MKSANCYSCVSYFLMEPTRQDQAWRKVLTMVEHGELSPDRALPLLKAFTNLARQQAPSDSEQIIVLRYTHINVPQRSFQLRIPISQFTSSEQYGARYFATVDEIDVEDVVRAIRAGRTGEIAAGVDNAAKCEVVVTLV